ncbi:hypothetical protein BDV12DRAFT_205527 [Aspergillus spectabilis]
MSNRTLLDRLGELCNVDVDDIDTAFIKSLPFKPHNQTSNQQIVCNAMLADPNRKLFTDMVHKYGDQGWEEPRHIHNKDKILQHCYLLATYFEEAGVSRDRFAIKIPFTGAAASAAAQLNPEGIRTLATSVFGLGQGIAASQSNCLFISPYFNEIAAYFDVSLWPSVSDPALEHPMSARLETDREQPIMVIASHFNTDEVMAMAEIGCQHITISKKNLEELMVTPDTLPPVTTLKPIRPYAELVTPTRLRSLSLIDPLALVGWDGKLASVSADYLTEGGSKLDQAIKADPIVAKRIQEAMKWFVEAEQRAKVAIEREIEATRGSVDKL